MTNFLHVYIDTRKVGTLREHAAMQWLTPVEMVSLDWAVADLPVLADYLAIGGL